MPLIKESEMPAPRFELRWHKTGDTWEKRECHYNIVLPLQEYDLRRENRDGDQVRDVMTIRFSTTKVNGDPFPFDPNGCHIEKPYRDYAHAKWDSESLKVPVYAVYEGYAMLLKFDTSDREPASSQTVRSEVFLGTNSSDK